MAAKKLSTETAKELNGGYLTRNSGFGFTGTLPKPANTNAPIIRPVSYSSSSMRYGSGSSGMRYGSGGSLGLKTSARPVRKPMVLHKKGR